MNQATMPMNTVQNVSFEKISCILLLLTEQVVNMGTMPKNLIAINVNF
jgi:hypothetical protein